MAAAYARSGDFQRAVALQEKAIRLAKKSGDKYLAEYEQRLVLYQSGKAYTAKN